MTEFILRKGLPLKARLNLQCGDPEGLIPHTVLRLHCAPIKASHPHGNSGNCRVRLLFKQSKARPNPPTRVLSGQQAGQLRNAAVRRRSHLRLSTFRTRVKTLFQVRETLRLVLAEFSVEAVDLPLRVVRHFVRK